MRMFYLTHTQVEEFSMRYDHMCTLNTTCDVRLNIGARMEPPIYFYYQLTNFYQNHRRYVKSRNDAQLRGESPADISSCDPLETWPPGPVHKDLNPCGLIANSFFNGKCFCVTHSMLA